MKQLQWGVAEYPCVLEDNLTPTYRRGYSRSLPSLATKGGYHFCFLFRLGIIVVPVMIRILTFVAALTLLTQGALCRRSIVITEEVLILPFFAKSENSTITFPADDSLPPILRSLTVKPSGEGFTADGPFLDLPGEGEIRSGKTLVLKFDAPRMRVRLTLVRISGTSLKLGGKAMHAFRRPFGMRLHRSRLSVPEGVAAAKKALKAKPFGARFITVIDHAAAAESVGLSLPDSSVVVFGSPKLESRLWPQRPPVGLDLPLEILVTSSPLGFTYIGWNTYSLIRKRFGISGAAANKALRNIEKVHALVGSSAAGRKLRASRLRFDFKRIRGKLDGVTVASTKGDALAAYDRLVAVLEAAPPVGIAYEVLHDELGKEVGAPTGGRVNRVVAFGNPAVGTKIMQRAFTAALDLPLRMSVWTTRKNAKRLFVGYTTTEWISRRHVVEVPEMLSAALESFTAAALGPEP